MILLAYTVKILILKIIKAHIVKLHMNFMH